MSKGRIVREQIWEKLREVARPDSRFHLNFAEVIPDFSGSDLATDRVVEQPFYRNSSYAFVTPDNCLVDLRRRMLEAGKSLVVSTSHINRGFYLLEPAMVPTGQELCAAWLDGMEHFGRPISLGEIADRGRFDFMVTGASAVSLDGIRFGKGHDLFDLEWGMFTEIGIVDEATPTVALVHDVQVVAEKMSPSAMDILVDAIATPTRYIPVRHGRRPRGIMWEMLEPEQIRDTPPLLELQRLRGDYLA